MQQLLALAKDKLENLKKVVYPCYVLGIRVETEVQLNVELSNLILFTYRKSFEALPRSSTRTDSGWGCLIRTTQMMLCRALSLASTSERAAIPRPELLFRDAEEAPFSIHNLVKTVVHSNDAYRPEFWLPSQGAQAIKTVVMGAVHNGSLPTPLTVVVSPSEGLNELELCHTVENDGPILLFIPCRCSGESYINQQTFMFMESVLVSTSLRDISLGIIGGVPARSYYLIGVTTDQRFLFLDPHGRTQPAFVDETSCGKLHEKADEIQTVAWNRIDVSIMFGFYLSSTNAVRRWHEFMKENEKKGLQMPFSILDTSTTKKLQVCDHDVEWPED